MSHEALKEALEYCEGYIAELAARSSDGRFAGADYWAELIRSGRLVLSATQASSAVEAAAEAAYEHARCKFDDGDPKWKDAPEDDKQLACGIAEAALTAAAIWHAGREEALVATLDKIANSAPSESPSASHWLQAIARSALATTRGGASEPGPSRDDVRRAIFPGDEYIYATVHVDDVTDRILALFGRKP